jgi:hypothetical protein
MNHVQYLHSQGVQKLHDSDMQNLHAGGPECKKCHQAGVKNFPSGQKVNIAVRPECNFFYQARVQQYASGQNAKPARRHLLIHSS